MVAAIIKAVFLLSLATPGRTGHPIYVSVTEIGHNAANKTLEITCKIFTEDFETTLRQRSTGKIDLLDLKSRTAMEPLVNGYIQQHLSIVPDGKAKPMRFLGFEQQEESIVSYFEVADVAQVKNICVKDNILYEYKSQQMEIIHVMVNGQRKSTRLNNPDDTATFSF